MRPSTQKNVQAFQQAAKEQKLICDIIFYSNRKRYGRIIEELET